LPSEYTDEELIRRLQSDDQQAFRLLYDRYWDKLLTNVLFKLGSEPEAEEVVQDAFIGLWRRRTTLTLRNSFYTYISAVVKYETLRRLAARKPADDLGLQALSEGQQVDDSTRQWLSYEELREQLEATIDALPEKCRLVFRLSREEGLTERQIAETLHISQKTVEAHKARALRALRISLGQFLHFLL